MEFGKDLKRILPVAIIVALGVLVFLLIKPILLSIVGGLILAYIFFPVYRKINQYIKVETISALITLIISFIVVFIPLWFVVPVLLRQVFEVFKAYQSLDVVSFVHSLFPVASDQFVSQMTTALNSFVSKTSSAVLNYLSDFLINSISLLLHLLIVGFVFFYGLRDSDKLGKLVKELSPLEPAKEKVLAKQFKDITNSLIFGQIFVGVVQGVLAGLGLFIFGIPNVLVLSATAIILSIVPVIGPWPIWIPAAIYLFAGGNTVLGILFVLYNLIIVSTVDNVMRAHIVSRKVHISSAIIFIGMMGGFFLFGIMGFIIGPLILVYFITFLKSYKDGYSLGIKEGTEKESIIPSAMKQRIARIFPKKKKR